MSVGDASDVGGRAMTDFGYLGSVIVLVLSVVVNGLVLAYRWPRAAGLRRAFDRGQRRITGRPDWSWLGLGTIMLPLIALTVVNIVWQVSTLHCGDDSLALLASGQAALAGHNPFLISYCSHSSPDQIPYGLAAVSLNALAAVSGTVAGVWIVWQLLALAVVPLIWAIGGEDRRYVSVLAASSVAYLPNIMTSIGVDNAIVPVSILLMLYALTLRSRRSGGLNALAAFLSTARFPALFPLLGSSASSAPNRARHFLGVLGVFLGAALVSYALWGRDAITIVYLNQFSRASGGTLNLFALLTQQGWLVPSLASALVQGIILIALVLFVNYRQYSARAAVAIPLIGVMSLSQYLNFHFVLWIVPLVLLGTAANFWLFLYAVGAAIDGFVAIGYLGEGLGMWGPYEIAGVLLSAILLALLYVILRDEEVRIRSRSSPPPAGSASAPTAW